MQKGEQLYEGKAKKVFLTENPDVLIVPYKDDATAFNGQKKGTIVGKGAINNRMTNHLFQIIEEEGVPTHYVQELNDRETAVRRVEIVPLEVIVRNIAAGSFSKRLGVPEGQELSEPTIEFSYKNDELGDTLINSYFARALMRSERIASLARYVICDLQNTAITASAQWFERTLDDSANKRLSVPEAFLATDAGKDNDLIERIKEDVEFGLTQEEMDMLLNPVKFTGMAEHQCEKFITEIVKPVLESNKQRVNVSAQINV